MTLLIGNDAAGYSILSLANQISQEVSDNTIANKEICIRVTHYTALQFNLAKRYSAKFRLFNEGGDTISEFQLNDESVIQFVIGDTASADEL